MKTEEAKMLVLKIVIDLLKLFVGMFKEGAGIILLVLVLLMLLK